MTTYFEPAGYEQLPRGTFEGLPHALHKMTATPMILAVYFLVLIALAGWSSWTAAHRIRDFFIIAFVAFALLPLLATTVTGDVSRYLPSAAFSSGLQGKDEIVMASALTTCLVATVTAAALLRIIKSCWRALRATGGDHRQNSVGEK